MPRGQWTSQADRAEIIRLRREGWHPDALAARFGVRRETVYRVLRIGLIPRGEKTRPKFCAEMKQGAADAYAAGESMAVIAARLGVDRTAVAYQLKQAGVESRSLSEAHRLYALDESAFDEGGPESNYWRGFVMADGCISERVDGSPQLIVALAAGDVAHLEKLRAFLKAGHPIAVADVENDFGKRRVARLAVTSRRLCDSLARCGICPAKSMTAKVIGLECDPDFWRGAVDGDGWLGFTGDHGCPQIGFVGSSAMVHQFAAFVRSLSPGCRANVHPMHSIWAFSTAGRHASAVIRKLYADAPVALDRKANLAERALAWSLNCRDLSSFDAPALLAARVKAGSWGAVARSLGLTGNALRLLRRRRGLPAEAVPERSSLTREALEDLKERLGTWRRVAEHLGMGASAVQKLYAARVKGGWLK